MIRRLFSILIFAICLNVSAQDVKTVEVEYTYIAPETMPPMLAKRIALEKAQLEAIANEFGTTIDQTNYTYIDSSSVDFKSYATSNSHGEWIATTREPEYDIKIEENLQIVSVKLKGKIRRIPESRAQIKMELCNKIENSYHTTTFHNGEPMYMKCRFSQNGYVMVFLEDEEGNAIRLLPFYIGDEACYEIKQDKEYVFFTEKNDTIDESLVGGEKIVLTASHDKELNIVTLIYSPSLIHKPIYEKLGTSEFEYVPSTQFKKWISRLRTSNPELIVMQTPVIIKL